MSECPWKTEELIQRTSYRKHRARLADIHHNQTSKNFHIPHKQKDKKGILSNQIKQSEIKHHNDLLHVKIESINARNNQQPKPLPLSSIAHKLKQSVNNRYEEEDDGKIDVRSDLSDGQPVRCIIPPSKNRAFSFLPAAKAPIRVQAQTQQVRRQRHQKPFLNLTSSNQHHSLNKKDKDNYYHPQSNQERQVLHQKTVVISLNQSCLYELSLIGDRILVTARMMGVQNYCLKEFLTAKRSKNILKDYGSHLEDIFSKISIEEYRIVVRQQEKQHKEKVSPEQRAKIKKKLQNQFIHRNFYSIKKQEGHSSEHASNKPTITSSRMQQLIQRLTTSKASNKYQPETQEQSREQPKSSQKIGSFDKILKQRKSPSKISSRKQESVKEKTEKQLEEEAKSETNKKSEQNLEEQVAQENYEEEFQKGSSIQNSPRQSDKNRSFVSQKSKQSDRKQLNKSLLKSKNNSNINEEDYETSFQEESRMTNSKLEETNRSRANNKSALVEEKVEEMAEEYPEQFQN